VRHENPQTIFQQPIDAFFKYMPAHFGIHGA